MKLSVCIVVFRADRIDEVINIIGGEDNPANHQKVGEMADAVFIERMEEMKSDVTSDEKEIALEEGHWEFGDTIVELHWPEIIKDLS